ncbi:MAG: hypothetical protein GQ560_01055 [Dehalococcoidia bacterium]|nr:hypothetical protein [Dehalococcoidia bacterium]
MEYSYVGYGRGGEIVKGIVEADSEKNAEESLWKSELTILSLKKKKARASLSLKEQLPGIYGVKTGEIIDFSRDLHHLLSAGIGIYPALSMLHERSSKASMKKLVGELILSVEGGKTFSEACAEHPKIFSPFYLLMVRVGEEVGNLEQMLEQVQRQMTKEMEIKKKVKSAMIYPAFVMLIAVGAVAALLVFLVPAISGLFDEMGGELPILTRMMIGLSDFVVGNLLYIALGIAAFITGYILFMRTPRGKRTKDRIMLKIPIIKTVIIQSFMARTARNLSILFGGGVTMSQSLDLVIQTCDNHIFEKAFVQVRNDVQEGLLLSQAMKKQPLFPPLLYQVVGVGELTGRLEPNLDSAADYFENETDTAVNRSVTMLTPIMTLFVGGMVMIVALSVYTPIYGLAQQLK